MTDHTKAWIKIHGSNIEFLTPAQEIPHTLEHTRSLPQIFLFTSLFENNYAMLRIYVREKLLLAPRRKIYH